MAEEYVLVLWGSVFTINWAKSNEIRVQDAAIQRVNRLSLAAKPMLGYRLLWMRVIRDGIYSSWQGRIH